MGNIIKEKSLDFGIKISSFYSELKSKKLFEVASQIFRSGTSIGANITEAQYAISKREFISKLQISLKESYETIYWFEILEKGFGLDCKLLKNDCIELIKILVTIIKSSKHSI